MGLPPIPPFEGLHPLIVHFPIGILLIAWIPMVVGLIVKSQRHAWMASAAMLLVVGTIGAFVTVLTGEAAEDIVGETSRAVGDAIHEHEETAELARNLFLGVTILFLAAWGVAAKIRPARRTTAASIGAVLVAVAYGVASVVLMNAGHQGGVLVHTHGIQAPLGSADPGAPAAGDRDHEHDEDEEDEEDDDG